MTSQSEGQFRGKRVLVTGGKGIGRGIIKRFYNEGATVFVISKSQASIDAITIEFPGVEGTCADLENCDDIQTAVSKFIPLDHVVNNSGISSSIPLLENTPEEFDRLFAVNLRGLWAVCKAFVNGNKETGHTGTIVNIGSIVDKLNLPRLGFYSATKAGVSRLTSSMAMEFAPFGIRVNCVNPGLIRTDMQNSLSSEFMMKAEEVTHQRKLIKEPLEIEDIEDVVVFLSSSASKQITGLVVDVDGGVTIG